MKNWHKKIHQFLKELPAGILSQRTINEKRLNLLRKWPIPGKENEAIERLSASYDLKNLFKKYYDIFPIDITKPEITHPISGERLLLNIPHGDRADKRSVEILENILERSKGPDKRDFFLIYESYRERLTSEDDDLGSLWKKIPCDRLIPDHSAWHHNALVSALSAAKKNPHLLFFSLGTMNFARPSLTMREFWVSSMILSYLVWSGMRAICDDFGPDHILYPAVSGQPLFHHWLFEKGLMELPDDFEMGKMGIPPFSNSFVALLPKNSLRTMIKKIECSIMEEWQTISDSVYEKLQETGNRITRKLWDREINNYWVFRNGTAPWFDSYDAPQLSETSFDIAGAKEITGLFDEMSGNSTIPGILYQASHELSQKRHHENKIKLRESEKIKAPGDRCSLCGKNSASFLPEDPAEFKNLLKKVQEISDAGILSSERLCPVCMTRRLAYTFNQSLPLPLRVVFQDTDTDFFEIEKSREYTAILSMDGDEMGKLVQGKNEKYAKWKEIMHSAVPEKIDKLKSKHETGPWDSFEKILNKRRLITPSVHQFLSESLKDFSLYTVPFVIKKYGGRILYAGGDDVVAVLPVRTALQAAHEIRDFYRTPFAKMNKDGSIERCPTVYSPAQGERLLTHLGKAVTMSAAVVFAKQGEHAGDLLNFARKMVDDEAKDNRGRDALAVVLKNDSGNQALVTGKWENRDGTRFIDELLEGVKKSSSNNESDASSDLKKIVNFLREYMGDDIA